MTPQPRLHVTSLVERGIPSVARRVRAAIMADMDLKVAYSAISELLVAPPSEPTEEGVDPPRDPATYAHPVVCSLLRDHLCDLSSAWIAHLEDVSAATRAASRRARMRFDRVKSLHTRYRSSNPGVVDAETSTEVCRVREVLEDELDAIRQGSGPVVPRGQALEDAIDGLHLEITTSLLSPREVAILQKELDDNVRAMELDVACDFAKRVLRLLQ